MTVSSILMVCMGNICRSPTAEEVLRTKLRHAGLAERYRVDSAGTLSYHQGEPPDARAIRHAARRGYDLSALRARPVVRADFDRFDLILGMDHDNLDRLQAQCPAVLAGKLGLLSDHRRIFADPFVPDPYGGDAADFEHVLDLVEDACDGLIEHLTRRT